MSTTARRGSVRRQPKQRRSQQTVDAVLEAVIRLLKKYDFQAITTNRIAEIAGVSIGSVYQYFPNKRAIFMSLHDRHVREIDRVIGDTLLHQASSSLEEFIRAIVDAMIEAHLVHPELHHLLLNEVPHRPGKQLGFDVRLHNAFRLAFASRQQAVKKGRDLDKITFIVTNMVDGLCHAAVLERPAVLSLTEAKEEVVRAVMAYLQS